MGASLAYLDEPIKDIHFESGSDSRQVFAVGEMQGWRLNMVSTYLTPRVREWPDLLSLELIFAAMSEDESKIF